jgi:glycosyltransferase involved in cell wall biosynthesis
MKILYFHQHFSTREGATGTRSYSVARRLVERGHTVTMVCGSMAAGSTGLKGPFQGGRRRGTVDGIDVLELELPYSNHDGFFKRAITFLKFALRSCGVAALEPCDVVFATSTPLTAAVPGIAARILRGRRFVFEVRDLWPELPKAMGVITNPFVLLAMSALEWAGYRCSIAAVGLAPGIVEGIRRRSNPRGGVHLIPNAADVELFQPAPQRAARAPGTPFRAVFAGAHGMANGLDAVLDTAAELKQRGRHDIEFHFIGDGKQRPGLIMRAARESLGNCVFRAPMAKKELVAAMEAMDAGLMVLANVPAFYFGTSPNKFFDYLACGMPVVCNYPGWIASLLKQHRCGIAVPPDDPKAFADALVALADDTKARTSMGRAARSLGESAFNRSDLVNHLCDVLEAAARDDLAALNNLEKLSA